jgi:plasmid stabilization system protein ParE
LDPNRPAGRAYDTIHDFNPSAAARMADALFKAGDRLVSFPHRGRPVRGTAMRELTTVSPCIIRYRVGRDAVVILRVRHSARRPTKP